MREIICSRCSAPVVTKYPKKTGRCRPCDLSVWRKAYRECNREKVLVYHREYAKANRHAILASKRKYNAKNRLSINAKSSAWLKANRSTALARTRTCNLKKQQRTPKWADIKKITDVYRACPKGMQVDHVIPLNGKRVCGFHVEYNLQYLTPQANLRKGNKMGGLDE